MERFSTHYPGLSPGEIEYVSKALKQFFLAYLMSGRMHLSMPSQIVDQLWHEFILDTQAYQRFCQTAFGKFLHHSPATSLKRGQRKSNEGIRRVWLYACQDEKLDPFETRNPPMIFRVDSMFGIAGAPTYDPKKDGLKARVEAAGTAGGHGCGGYGCGGS